MRTVVVRFADAAAYYIATAGFIGVSRRAGRGVRRSFLHQRNEQELTQNVDVAVAAAAGTCGNQTNSPLVGRLGDDAHGKLIASALGDACGVHLDYVRSVTDESTGHAVVMLQSDGENSIIIVGGTNLRGWPEKMSDDELEIVRNAGVVLLQREILDFINIQVAKVMCVLS